MLEPGDRAPELNLRDSTGKTIALSSLWKRNPVVLAFLRHTG